MMLSRRQPSPASPRTAGVAGQPTWFGPESAPLFGVVHVPSGGQARAGVVICPPLGKEHVDTYGGLKLLAQKLCEAGFAVLRFDYRGTGDSSADQGCDTAVGDFLDSVDEAVAYLRASGVPSVGLVGLRMGALLGALRASASDISHLVLWDPVTSGRRYLREQRTLYRMMLGDAQGNTDGHDDSEPIPGLDLSSAAAAEIKRLRLPAVSDREVLALARPDRAESVRVDLQDSARTTLLEVSGQAEFVEPPSFVVKIPVGTIDAITAWLDARMPTTRVAVTPVIRRTAIVATLSDGTALVEEIDELGPHRLFAIRTTASAGAADGPTLLIHNTAAQHRVGPGRVWVETARELAGRGVEVIRYDRRGTGETGLATPDFAPIYSKTTKEDIRQAISATGTPPERLMMTGLCSGAWSSAYGALVSGARSVVLVNAIVYSVRQLSFGLESLLGLTTPEPGARPSSPTKRRIWEVFKTVVRRTLPYPLWLQLGRLGLTQVPEVLLKPLRDKTSSVDIVLSPDDYAWFETQRGNQSVARLSEREWRPTVAVAPSGDHALLERDFQNYTRRYLAEVAARDFGVTAPAGRRPLPARTCSGVR
jgi:pimeloyl-ACP methyl ester carboxylesterase